MRAGLITVAVLAILTTGTAQRKQRSARPPTGVEQQSREAEDRAGIQKLQEKDIAASTSFDIDALLSLWTEDGVLLPPQHSPVVGRDALKKFYEQQQAALGNAETLGYEELWQEVRIIGDFAYQWGEIQTRTRAGQGNAESSTVVNAMRILKRDQDGNWRVARAIYNQARSSTSVGQPSPAPGEQR